MALRRKQPPPPCPCGCEVLAQRLAEAEALHAALARAVAVLRPKAAHHSLEAGLTGWGVDPADAALIAAAARRPRT